MTENTVDRSPDDIMDPDKEARMLLNPPAESVQFTQSGATSNGQVVLPINNGRLNTGVGMTKQELMKYANDPFWVRLRMFLFILFWVVWLSMLFGAVAIIAFAPGCPATASLPWWKRCSMVQVTVPSTEKFSIQEKFTSAAESVEELTNSKDAIKDAQVDVIIIKGLDSFLLSEWDNSTEANATRFKKAFANLVTTLHEDEKTKVMVSLDLTETLTSHKWFVEAKKNGSVYSNYYIWRGDFTPLRNLSLRWIYDTDKLNYYASRVAGSSNPPAILNYADNSMRDVIKALTINWMKTKVDGILTEGDFWVDDPTSGLHISADVTLQVHKWVKSGGQNKALLLSNSALAPQLTTQGEDAATFELAPDSEIWNKLSKANKGTDVKAALEDIFNQFVKEEEELLPNVNTTTTADSNTAEPVNVGAGWHTHKVKHPASTDNDLAARIGQQGAEGVLVAFYLLPKSSPLVLQNGTSITEQLKRVKEDKLLAELNRLRRDQSETLLLGRTVLPKLTNADQVFALYRRYKDKNAYLLLINFSANPQVVNVLEALTKANSLPNSELFTPRVVLTDSKSINIYTGDLPLGELKLASNQTLLIEFAAKE